MQLVELTMSGKRRLPLRRGQKPCRHCGETRACRPRGLCWACYYNPFVRPLYEPVSKMAKIGAMRDHHLTGIRALPEPTEAEPGTEEKIRVLINRLASNQHLFHPRDRRIDES